MSLQNIIVKDACNLDESSKQNLERHLNTLSKAAGTFYAKSALQHDQISSVVKAKVQRQASYQINRAGQGESDELRRSNSSMSDAQEKEAAKEAARERKMKNSRRNIMNDAEFEDTPSHVTTAAHRNGTEAEPGMFGAKAQSDENVLRKVQSLSSGRRQCHQPAHLISCSYRS